MKFNCGCEFEKLEWESVNLHCPATWDLVGEGLTKGVFQLEKSLGRRWSKKIKPRNLEELADVISLIRPGCLEAEYREDRNGKMLSITETYVKVKAGELEPEYIHESLKPIMENTYGVLIYQEQIMDICKEFAGFTLLEADNIRRAVGKKDEELIASLEESFVKNAVKLGRDENMAKLIFSWIEKFSRYGFNKSHAVGYAMVGYWTAYAKSHFPIEFFKAKLSESDGKIDELDEIKQLVHEAKLFNIKVLTPSVRRMNKDFAFTEDNSLAFGLSHIKGVGESALDSLGDLATANTEGDVFRTTFTAKPKKSKKTSVEDEEMPVSTKDKKATVKKNTVEALIKAGALDHVTGDRVEFLKKFLLLVELTPREQQYLISSDVIESGSADELYSTIVRSGLPNEKRLQRIEQSYIDLSKNLGGNRRRMMLAFEKFHLGMALSGSEVELYFNQKVDTTCRDFLRMRNETKVSLGVMIEDVRRTKDKNGNWMAFANVSDATYMLDGVVVFASTYSKVGWLLEPGKIVLMRGKKRDVSLLVDSIEHL